MEIDSNNPVQVQRELELPLPTTQLQPEPQPLSFNLSAATLLFLQRLGALPSARLEQDTTVQNKSAYSTTQWTPLLPLADLQLLLSTLPASLLPADLPFAIQSAPQSASTRQAVLDTLARLALEPSLTMEIMRRYTPLSVHLWGRWLEMLGFSAEGEWRSDGQEVEGERVAVEKVYRAMVACVTVYDNIFPFLTTLLRHPLLNTAPLPAPNSSSATLAPHLLTLHSLLHHLPHLPFSSHTSNATRIPWSFPSSLETILKSHPHRGTRLVAWRILREWYALYAGMGEDLREQWVWKGEKGDLAPMPGYPEEYKEEWEARFGPFEGKGSEEDLLEGWEEELVGEARLVDDGLEVLVRRRSVDAWVLSVMEDTRAKEERNALAREGPLPQGWLSESEQHLFDQESSSLGTMDASELSNAVVIVEGYLLFREGFLPSASTSSPSPANTAAEISPSTAQASTTSGPQPEPFISTPGTGSLLRQLALHVQQRLPVLLTSPPSSGKTATITHLWSTLHAAPSSSTATAQARQRGLVLINLADRSLDSKSLLGSLSSAPTTSTSTAGSFTFIEGPLTRALRQGRWVVLTSIDQASVEVLTVIKVVVERMRRAAESGAVGASWGGGAGEEDGGVGVRVGGGEGRWVKAGKGFMLFATRSTTSEAEPAFFASTFWSEVRRGALGREEVGRIVDGRYPALGKAGLGARLIEAWEKVGECQVKEGVHVGTVRPVGVRDLMRWCRRVEGLLPQDVAIKSIESNPTLQEEIFTEARDVFLGSLPLPSHPLRLAEDEIARDRYSVVGKVLAAALSLSPERADWVLRRRVPDFVEPIIDESDGQVSTRTDYQLKIGRVSLPYIPPRARKAPSRPYALTNPSLVVLEKLAVCLRLSEPVLMVGETGTGKTAAVGHLAEKMGKKLRALNLSNQTEAGDLVGGFRPIDEVEEARRTASELVNRFVDLFGQTFSLSRNAEFVNHVRKAFDKKRWPRLVGLWREASRMAADRIGSVDSPAPPSTAQPDAPRKRRKVEPKRKEDLPVAWRDFGTAVGDFDLRHVQKAGKSKFVFSFVEGPLAKAIRDGDWVLLDEVNLASAETLESLSTLLQAPDSSLVLTEQGDLEPIPRHPGFRLFACMNPATDVGKRDLPAGLRAKFSEVWVPPPDEDRDALVKIVEGYISRQATNDLPVIGNVADLYSAVKALAIGAQLADGANHPPHFSMRTLARALTFAAEFAETFGSLRRALYEGFLMSFTMLLDPKSQEIVSALIAKHIVEPARNARSLFKQKTKRIDPSIPAIFIDPYWLATGSEEPQVPRDYILTASVQRKVADLARAVLTRKVPVLIQGPTSAGKTSVVEYLAKRTGHRFVRINNHEHTDIQEYVGTYVSDPDSGKLVFQEGVLVRALRRGDWIVLDELNLAPTDVLEALNRLLDDNRELLIPETGEVVRPHPHFMLFATQNPPGLYGGRKVLSRAFRNRFLEMHFGDVPKDELETILCQRCEIAPSYAKKTVAVFLELQRRRQAGRVFEQKHAFATLRDLFRWGGRGSVGYQQLAEDGYMLLAERARRPDDKATVKDVIEQEMKVKIDETTLYDFDRLVEAGLPDPRPRSTRPTSTTDMDQAVEEDTEDQSDLVWTSAMRRLYFLIAAALHRNEPVLLVGETGSGKTSVCQSLALALNTRLHVVGCHQNTETADLLGGQRPLRNRASLQSTLQRRANDLLAIAGKPASTEEDDFEDLVVRIEAYLKVAPEEQQAEVRSLFDEMRKTTALFEWHDGPLVQAMHAGALILLDEISLADDSVLERLNSVLEPSRTLVLAEKGGRDLEDIRVVGAEGFQILATMNPGGDFGKKELSPALRNRFTEIWVPGVDDLNDLSLIIGSRWEEGAVVKLAPFGAKILEFAQWLGAAIEMTGGLGIGLRDILGWIDFLNKASSSLDSAAAAQGISGELQNGTSPIIPLDLADSFCQGALMTVVDGLGALPATSGLSKDGLEKLRTSCWRYLETLVPSTMAPESLPLDVVDSAGLFSVGPFGVKKGALPSASVKYTLLAPTTRLNAMRLLRALQLKKPVLLEGSPGVGKTSLVTAMAAATGHNLVRINLSDQTDLMDLLGSDLPVEGGKSGEFAWKDAPFLAAMQQGDWVLLDEMNLASQSILEGLNSCLDHRGTVFIPELDRTFTRHEDFRIFAAQNPLGQGGGRKGLPRSFLDRFSVVHMEELNSVDLNAIANSLYPDVDSAILSKMIAFNTMIHQQTMESRSFGMEGSPWEFNLRDVLRWLSLVRASTGLDLRRGDAVEYVGLLYLQRFRTLKDRTHVARIFADFFADLADPSERPSPSVGPRFAQIGHSLLPRSDASIAGRQSTISPLLQRSLQPLEALVKTLDMGWLAILTGPRASGKTTLVRQVAALGGRTLREFSMSAEVDTLELLGSFEQAERFREFDRITVASLALVQRCVRAQFTTASSLDFHHSLSILQQLRIDLGVGAADFDLEEAATVVRKALACLDGIAETKTEVDEIMERVQAAVTETSSSARFEWIDGPLVQAMQKGDWLLIEDANLCSPSVLDRLNSLFETGGRLQLAERGPVNGEIQVIHPHPDFRLVMTLDPRNGELSRAMRNRGIEIALLANEEITTEDSHRLAQSSRIAESSSFSTALISSAALLHGETVDVSSDVAKDVFAPNTFAEPAFTPILAGASAALRSLDVQSSALVQNLVSTISPAHYGLALRFLRSLSLQETAIVDSSVRELDRHALVQQVQDFKASEAASRSLPLELLALQPTDVSLVPQLGSSTSPVHAILSPALDALTSLLLFISSRPEILRIVSAKPVRSLNVWEKSLLSANGKLRLDDADPAMLSLFPVNAALAQLVGKILGLPLASLEPQDQQGVVRAAKLIQTLVAELEHICGTDELDFSSIQHVAAWIVSAIEQLPAAVQHFASDANAQLAPLRSSLTLTSGKAMSEIWRTCLPFEPASQGVADAYHSLLERGQTGTGEAWDKTVVDLFLDIAVALGTPQPTNGAYEAEAPELVKSLLLRIPVSQESDAEDPSLALSAASNAASVAVAELAAVANVFGLGDQHLASSTLVRVAHKSGVVPLASIVPVHQLVSWPKDTSAAFARAKPSVEFKTLLNWNEHLALGLDSSMRSPADVVRPSLLRAVVALRSTDTSSLGNLIILSGDLGRAASLQAWTAASDSASRVSALGSALLASIALTVNSCREEDKEDIEQSTKPFDAASDLNTLLADNRQLSPALQESLDRYLAGALPDLTSRDVGLGAIGRGFVAFARCFWHLYLPNLPLDPAVGLRAHSGFLGRQLVNLSSIFATLQTTESALTGNSRNPKMDRIGAEVESLRQQLESAGVVPVTREGNPALLSSLFQELRAFQDQIISDAQLDSLLEDLQGSARTELASREANLQRSVETLLRRLNLAYVDLRDILAPVRLALCSLKIGFSLLLHVAQSTSLPPTTTHFGSLLHHLASFPTAAHSQAIDSVDLPVSIKVGEAPLAPARATLLQVTALTTRLANYAAFDRDALRRLTQLYDRLHYLWSADRRHEEEAAREAESLYKSKADNEQIASDEELEAAEFAKLFPTFDEPSTNDDPAKPTTNGAPSAPARLLYPADQANLARLHVGIFANNSPSFGKTCADDFDTLRSASITTLLPKLFDGLDETLDRHSAVYRIRSLVELSQAAAPSADVEAPHHDFYNEPNVRETAKAVPILLALSSRLSDLIALWPDQMVLQNLRDRCQAVLSLSSQSPIAQVLTAFEQLLQHTEDWESYASREHSISTNRTAIINLVVEWRRFELTCWSRLLTTVQERFGDPVAEWWFRFYETTIRGAPGVDVDPENPPTQTPAEYYRDLVALLDSFMASSSLGQYRARLQLVLSFAHFAAKLGEKSLDFEEMDGADSLRTVSQLMLNIHGFYNQFTPRVDAFLTTERARIEKDVQNLIKLASWKDVNVYALRQSAIRSHHMLYKSVRKLRAVLQKPASDFFSIPDAEKTAAPAFAQAPYVLELGAAAPLPALPAALTSSDESVHIVRLEQTLTRLGSLVTSAIDPFVSLDRATEIDDLAVQIITTAKELRDESKAGPEEGREQRVKNLATRKRRAWIELLREIKRVGLSPAPAPDVVARLQDPGFVYSLASSHPLLELDSSLLPEPLRLQLVKSDDYHFRLLSELPALRACPANHHDDVSTREVQRAIGSIESCIALGFENRSQIIAAVANQVRLFDLAKRMEAVGVAVAPQAVQTSRKLAETFLDRVSRLIDALAEASSELNNHRLALGRAAANISSVEVAFTEASSLLARDQDRLEEVVRTMGTFDPVISTPEEFAVFAQARENLQAVVAKLSTSPCPSSIRYLIDPLAAFASSLVVPDLHSASPVAADVASLQAGHKTLVDSILVIAQELKKVADKEVTRKPEEEDELPDLIVKRAGRSLQETLAIFRLPEMLEQVDSLTRSAHLILSNPSASTQASAAILLHRVSPFLRLFAELIRRHLTSFLQWHKGTLKLSYILASVVKELSAEGFCRPSEDDGKGGEQADGKTSDGTGMADGQGAKNVSKEIEEESQVEGLENDVEQDKEKNEKEEQEGDDDAVEMSMDFEGEMEDRGDGDKDEDEDDDDDSESQPDPEEQIADVDPLDPSSVDEKFWGDEESKDESKEGKNEEVNQETTKSAGESDMAAKDEDNAAKPEPKGEQGEDASAEEEEKKKEERQGQEDGTEMEGDAEGDEEGEKEEQEDGEGEGEDADADAVQDDNVERLDDRMPEADNLDLPDDMNLDGEDKKEDDDLDMGSDMDSLPADPEDGENDNQPDELDEMSDPKDQEGDNDDDALHPENDAAPETEAPSEEQPQLDQSLGGAQDGETGGEGAQDNSSAAKPDPAAAPDVSQQPGTQAEDASAPEPVDEDAQEGAAEDADMNDDSTDPAPSAPSNSADGQSKQRSSAADPKSDPSRPHADRSQPAEPQRSLGDTLQSWRRRLEAINDMTEEEDTPQAEADPSSAPKDGEVEYVQEGDENEQDEQALGPANEEQVQGLEKLRLGEDETDTGFEPDAMEVDDQTPTLPQQTSSTVQLDGSSLAESDAKAIPAAELREDRTQAEEDLIGDEEIMRDEDEELLSSTLAPPIDPEADAAVEQQMLQWRSGEDPALTADGVWRLYESLTRDLSYALTEQLRLILEPTLATRLKGDYRSGKRLNLKKIIPYIASEFTKDKIWLRRTRPSQREYQILIAIDDSKSMADSHSVHLAYQTLALISRALTRLEVGGVSICRFGDSMDVLHPFEGGPVSDEAGANLLGKFTFAQRTTDVRLLVERSLAHLALAKENSRSGKTSLAAGDLWQLQIIISDGMCQDHEKLRALLRRAAEEKVMFVFVVIDSLHRRIDLPDSTSSSAPEVNQNSILAMKSVSYSKGADGRLELKMDRYLDSFPFEYFVVLRDVEALPEVLSSTLRQFFEKVSSDR